MQSRHICESWHTNRGKLPTDYLLSTRVFLPKASVARNWVIRNLRRIQFVIQEEQVYTECGARLNVTSIYLSYCVFFLYSFRKKISTKHDVTSTESPTSFSHWRFPSWGEIKPPTPVLQTIHFHFKHMPISQPFLYLKENK